MAILNRCSTIDQQIFYILYAEYEQLKFKELERAITDCNHLKLPAADGNSYQTGVAV